MIEKEVLFGKGKNVFDELLDGINFKNLSPGKITGITGIIKYLTKSFLERALNAELTDELGYENKSTKTAGGNQRSQRY